MTRSPLLGAREVERLWLRCADACFDRRERPNPHKMRRALIRIHAKTWTPEVRMFTHLVAAAVLRKLARESKHRHARFGFELRRLATQAARAAKGGE